MKQETSKRNLRFSDLGLSTDLLKVLERLNFTTPTPIQQKAIPLALEGKDVIGVAQTGTGKTFAFALPMIQNILQNNETGLIVVPTRELAFQVREEIDKAGGRLGFKTALLIGGANIGQQIRSLRRNPHIVVATPGRLIDHIERKTVRLNKVCMLVLDEADRMLDMGFAPQINQILKAVPDERQTMLFSATIPEAVAKIGRGYMQDPVHVEVAPTGTSAKNIKQGVYYIDASKKFDLLQALLRQYEDGPVLVFCRTKHGTQKMARVLNRDGYRTEELHSNRSLNQRRYALANFKSGKSRTLIATDVAARGLDVKEIALVVNYDIPERNEDYVHRIGRTGRAGHTGCAVSFVMPEQFRDLKAIERLVGIDIEVLEGPGTLTVEQAKSMSRSSRPSKQRHGRSYGRAQKRRPSSSRQYSNSSSSSRGYDRAPSRQYSDSPSSNRGYDRAPSGRTSGRTGSQSRNSNRSFTQDSPERYDPRRRSNDRRSSAPRRSGGGPSNYRSAGSTDDRRGGSPRRSGGGYARQTSDRSDSPRGNSERRSSGGYSQERRSTSTGGQRRRTATRRSRA